MRQTSLFSRIEEETKRLDGERYIVAFSGGKDSTALALKLSELGADIRLIFTPTGNELPGVIEHIERVATMTGSELIIPDCPTLAELIEEQDCLPSWRMRWCTRMIKIEPCLEWFQKNPGNRLAVGLRADEQGRKGGTYDDLCNLVYPLREWGWALGDVVEYLERKEICIPRRTDCAVCFYQTLYELHILFRDHQEHYKQGEAWEAQTGHSFRSPTKDKWPGKMCELRPLFEQGWIPTTRNRGDSCRVCSM